MNGFVRRCCVLGAGASTVLAAVLCGAEPVRATSSYFVDSTATTADVAPGDGVCADAAARCTLTAALGEAEAAGAPATIEVPNGTYRLFGPLMITADITVAGNDSSTTTVDFGGGAGFVVDGARFALVDLEVRGGSSPTDGGVIRAVDAAVTLTRIRAQTNRAAASGGAIHATRGSLQVDQSEFVDNTALVGGGIAVTYTSLSVARSSFVGNGASGDGGAVFASYPAGFAVVDSTFDDNVALGRGGAVFVNGIVGDAADTPLLVSTSEFTGNSAGNEGGAVFIGSTTNGLTARSFDVAASTFANNTGLVGGAVAIDVGSVTAWDSTFESNRAVGGAGGAIGSGGSLSVAGSSFTQNVASQSGGAIASNGPTTISESSFESNEAGALGGAVALLSDSTPSVSTSSFTNNVADVDAGAIWRFGEELDQASNTLSGNLPSGAAIKVGGPTYAAPPTTAVPPSTTPVSTPTTLPGSGPTTTWPVPTGPLPESGSSIGGLLVIGGVLIGIGLALRVPRRRRGVRSATR